MDFLPVPEQISYELLLAALEAKYAENLQKRNSIYCIQLRQSLLALSRKARLEVRVQLSTGLAPSELNTKSTLELLRLLDKNDPFLDRSYRDLLRFW